MRLEDFAKLKRLHRGIAWLRKEDWPRWLDIDPDFQYDYDYWHRRMQGAYERLKAAGVSVVKVEVLPEEFIAWAQNNGCPFDTRGRSAYAAWKVQRMHIH